MGGEEHVPDTHEIASQLHSGQGELQVVSKCNWNPKHV